MSRVRIAVAGAGLIGRRHVELIQESGSCELSAIVDPAPDAADFAREAGVPIYPTLANLFAMERPTTTSTKDPGGARLAEVRS